MQIQAPVPEGLPQFVLDRDALCSAFETNFEVVVADSPALVKEVLALRYQVYCLERGYEDPEKNSDGCERDEFDCRSVYGFVRHRRSARCIGAVRLVLCDTEEPESPFPVEAHCRDVFFPDASREIRSISRVRLGEISRFAVSRQFRRRYTEADYIQGISPHVPYFDPDQPGSEHRRMMPHVTLGLFAAVIRLSKIHGVTHWFAVMEPTLLRLLRRFGIHFPTIGPIVEYHGRRQPTLAVASELAERARGERPDVWDLVTDRGRELPPTA